MHYMATSQSTIDQQKEFDIFLTMLSPSLKIEVTKYIFHAAMSKNPVFENRLDIIEQMLHDLKTSLFIPEDEICRQGSIGNFLLTILQQEKYSSLQKVNEKYTSPMKTSRLSLSRTSR